MTMAEKLKQEGNQAYRDKDHATALDKFSKVIKIEPYNRKYYNLHAATYLRLGEYEKARQDAGKAIDIKPGCSSWCLWGQASFWLGYSKEARNAYERARKLEPSNKSLLTDLKAVLRGKVSPRIKEEDSDGQTGEGHRKADSEIPRFSKTPAKCEGQSEKTATDMALRESSKRYLSALKSEAPNPLPGQALSSPSFPIIGTPEYVSGYIEAFPAEPAALLQAWHRTYPSDTPPCSSEISASSKRKWKIFDRDGQEPKYTVFRIDNGQSAPYKVIVVYNLAGADKLVSCEGKSARKTFLLEWKGVGKGFEDEAAAIQIVGRSFDEIVFHEGVFHRVVPKISEPQGAIIDLVTASTPRHRSFRARTQVTSYGEGNLFDFDYEAASSGGEHEKEPQPPTKRIKVESPSPSPLIQNGPTGEAMFKLVAEQSNAVSYFPVAECRSSKELFWRAQRFFRVFDGNAEGSLLACQVPGEREQHYLFEGSEGQFHLLVGDASDSTSGRVVIEVKCVI